MFNLSQLLIETFKKGALTMDDPKHHPLFPDRNTVKEPVNRFKMFQPEPLILPPFATSSTTTTNKL